MANDLLFMAFVTVFVNHLMLLNEFFYKIKLESKVNANISCYAFTLLLYKMGKLWTESILLSP